MLYSSPNKRPIEVDARDEGVDKYLQGAISDGEGGTHDENLAETSETDALMDLETFGSGLMFPLPKKANQCKETAVQSDMGERKLDSGSEVSCESLPIKSQAVSTGNKNQQVSGKSDLSQMGSTTRLCTGSTSVLPGEEQIDTETSSSGDGRINRSSESSDLIPNTILVSNSNQGDRTRNPENVQLSDCKNQNLTSTITGSSVEKSEAAIAQESPKSPDPENETVVQSDIVRDSPQSPDPDFNSPLQGGMAQDSPQSPDAKMEALAHGDDIQDSPQSPDSKAKTILHGDIIQDSFQSPNANKKPLLQGDTVQDSPQSPDSKTTPPPCSDVMQNPPQSPDSNNRIKVDVTIEKTALQTTTEGTAKRLLSKIEPQQENGESDLKESKRETNDDSDLSSPLKKQRLHNMATLNISSSDFEGELIIASSDDTPNEEVTKQKSSKDAKKPSSKACKEGKGIPSIGSVKTRRVKRLETPSDESEEEENIGVVTKRRSKRIETPRSANESEEENIGVVTRRRSARLRKADGSDNTSPPPKKVKKTSNKVEVKAQHEGKEHDDSMPDLSVKDEGAEKVNIEKTIVCESTVTENIEGDKVSKTQESMETEPSHSTLEPKTTSNSTEPTTTNRTNAKTNVNSTAKKPRTRDSSKSHEKKSVKPGGVSSTIDTIMKLQEQLHTRRQQKASGAPRSNDGGSMAESNQVRYGPNNVTHECVRC